MITVDPLTNVLTYKRPNRVLFFFLLFLFYFFLLFFSLPLLSSIILIKRYRRSELNYPHKSPRRPRILSNESQSPECDAQYSK